MSNKYRYYSRERANANLEITRVVYRSRNGGRPQAVVVCQGEETADQIVRAFTERDELLAACKAALPYMADLTEEGTTERESEDNRGESRAYRKLLHAVNMTKNSALFTPDPQDRESPF